VFPTSNINAVFSLKVSSKGDLMQLSVRCLLAMRSSTWGDHQPNGQCANHCMPSGLVLLELSSSARAYSLSWCDDPTSVEFWEFRGSVGPSIAGGTDFYAVTSAARHLDQRRYPHTTPTYFMFGVNIRMILTYIS